jgi:hypothetical protein
MVKPSTSETYTLTVPDGLQLGQPLRGSPLRQDARREADQRLLVLARREVHGLPRRSRHGQTDHRDDVPLDLVGAAAEREHERVAHRPLQVCPQQGARCVQLLRDGELNTGACDTFANEAIVGDRSVIFGKVPSRAVSVRIPLSNGDLGSAEVQEKDGYRWYSFTVPQEVDIDGEPTFVDADGGSD